MASNPPRLRAAKSKRSPAIPSTKAERRSSNFANMNLFWRPRTLASRRQKHGKGDGPIGCHRIECETGSVLAAAPEIRASAQATDCPFGRPRRQLDLDDPSDYERDARPGRAIEQCRLE